MYFHSIATRKWKTRILLIVIAVVFIVRVVILGPEWIVHLRRINETR
jgi:hypothetical protein